MKNLLKQKPTLLILITTAIMSSSATAFASTAVSSPTAGTCYQGGTVTTLSWSNSGDILTPNNYYVSYDNGGGHTTSPTASNIPGGDGTTATSLAWTLPNTTSSTNSIFVESLLNGSIETSSASSANFSIDSTGPSTPTIVSATPTQTTANLSWIPSSDPGCMGLTGYNIIRNNQVIASTPTSSYTDTNVQPGTTYNYVVEAYDGFTATYSAAVSVTTPAKFTPTKHPQPTAVAVTGNSNTPTPTNQSQSSTNNMPKSSIIKVPGNIQPTARKDTLGNWLYPIWTLISLVALALLWTVLAFLSPYLARKLKASAFMKKIKRQKVYIKTKKKIQKLDQYIPAFVLKFGRDVKSWSASTRALIKKLRITIHQTAHKLTKQISIYAINTASWTRNSYSQVLKLKFKITK